MRGTTVTLGGKTYEVQTLPIRAAREWRDKFQKPFQEIATALSGMDNIELSSGKSVSELINVLRETLLHSPDTILEMLYAYSPIIAADKERIEAEAFDDEVMAALVGVLKLAYPFGSLLNLIPGPVNKPTLTNSPAPSGASGQKS